MAILNPVVSKFALAVGTPQEVYVCPPGKTHAIVDISFLKDDMSTTSLIAVGLATESNPNLLTTVDYFVDDIELISTSNSAELNKIMVGTGERLFVKVMSGSAVTCRLSGVEENNPKVLKAGRLAAASIAGTSQTQLFANALANVAYIVASVTVFNTSTTSAANVEMWVSTGATPAAADKVMLVTIAAQDTTIVENVLMSPNERLFVRSSVPNSEYFVVGAITSV